MLCRVTEELIAESRRRLRGDVERCANCPVALAISAVLGIPVQVVGPRYYTWIGKERITHLLPKFVHEWICEFDNGKEVKPFDFEITNEAIP
jgi:hypothetical protein